MNIENLQKEVYFEDDGMLRDIYVLNTTKDDWKKWVEIVNEKYVVDFYNGQTEKIEGKINFETVLDVWTGKTDKLNEATIKLDAIDIKCHFFTDEEIENDIDPIQIKTIEDHNKLMDYLRTISKAINKRVILTPENIREVVLIDIDREK
ncbi:MULTISPECIES: hypothetical protein [Flavobacterium]|uniref:Uncharacterized protein n=1 Tax=Flavobacterium jumunjinense TaxID=998845 RepID=A0ABV5GJ63_9FLAO|nr:MULTISPECIES: hypothetical protein [Flavobacterium]